MATTSEHAAPLGRGENRGSDAAPAAAAGADAPASDAPASGVPCPPLADPVQCSVERCAQLVCGKWTLLIVRDLAAGPRSFSELEASLGGISPRTLCERLKLLVAEGAVTRTRIKALPPRSIYELTELGHALVPVVEAMRTAGEQLLDPRR